jgi:hypothetical protein
MSSLKVKVIFNEDPHNCVKRREITLTHRARKHTLRGERREAMLPLKQACFLAEDDARPWAGYAASCWRKRPYDDFLRARNGEASVSRC